jgi:hypothetical protein
MKILKSIQSLFLLPILMFKWFHSTTISPKSENGKPLPPIRYDGDPTDIYLA